MVALIKSSTLVGIDAVRIDVECVIAAGQNADAMGKCNNLMPKDVQQKMTERMSKMM